MPDWGRNDATGFSSVGGFTGIRIIGGTFDSVSGATLTSVSMYLSSSSTTAIRVAVYRGGTLTNPVGATLVEDLGALTVTGAAQFYTRAASGAALTSGELLWIAGKADGSPANVNLWTSGSSANAGSFQTARGRAAIPDATGGADETVAFPATLDGTATFANTWLPWYLTYSTSGGPSPAAFRAYYAHTSG